MGLHKDIPVGAECAHPPGYVQSGALGAVGAHKIWVDTSTTPYTWKIRAADNLSWIVIAGPATYATVAALAAAVAAVVAPAFVALTDDVTVTWATAGAAVNNAKVTLGGNRTLDITGAVNGASGELRVTQDGTGGRTLTLPVGSKVVDGPLALAPGAGALTILAWSYDGTTFVFTYGEAV